MPDRLPPRPAPVEEIIILLRRLKSGFVVYPKYIPKRMVDGRARFMTKCDMLVGPCACGYTHQEHEGWVRETLQYQNLRFEPLILWGEEQQRGMVVEIPGYWKQDRNWGRSNCDVLVGKCSCGRTHSVRDGWVRELLRKHGAVILNLPLPEDADVEPERLILPPSRSRNRQAEDRIQRRGTPQPVEATSGTWWNAPEYSRGGRYTGAQSVDSSPVDAVNPPTPVDIAEFVDMALPPEYQERVGNAEGAMAGCTCSACENRRQQARDTSIQIWASQARMVRDTFDEDDMSDWGIENCNEAGEVPTFCNCPSCCSHRMTQVEYRVRDQIAPPVEVRANLTFEIPERDGDELSSLRSAADADR